MSLTWLLISSLLVTIASFDDSLQCELTMRSSALGFGLYAGREWSEGLLETAIGVPVPLAAIFGTQLINYVEGLNDTHCLLALGQTLLVNHITTFGSDNLRKFMTNQEPLYRFREPYGWSIDISYEMRTTVLQVCPHFPRWPPALTSAQGEELLTNYGGDDWLEDRGMVYTAPAGPSVLLPGCPNEWTSLQQTLVAARAIPKDTVIETSRALLLPTTSLLLASGPLEELLWWPSNATATDLSRYRGTYAVHPYSTAIDYAVLLTGRGPFYGPAGDGRPVNVRYEWLPPDVLMGADGESSSACSLLAAVRFIAGRDIAEGEELIVDLAEDSSGRRTVPMEFALPCLLRQ